MPRVPSRVISIPPTPFRLMLNPTLYRIPPQIPVKYESDIGIGIPLPTRCDRNEFIPTNVQRLSTIAGSKDPAPRPSLRCKQLHPQSRNAMFNRHSDTHSLRPKHRLHFKHHPHLSPLPSPVSHTCLLEICRQIWKNLIYIAQSGDDRSYQLCPVLRDKLLAFPYHKSLKSVPLCYAAMFR